MAAKFLMHLQKPLVSYPVKKADDIISRGLRLLISSDQLAILTQCPKHVDTLPV